MREIKQITFKKLNLFKKSLHTHINITIKGEFVIRNYNNGEVRGYQHFT